MSAADSQNFRLPAAAEASADRNQSAKRALHQRSSFTTAVVVLLYVGSYSILSANGEYRWRPSGLQRYGFGMAMFDLSLWCPPGVDWERRKSVSGDSIIDANPLGWFYLPMIAADRRWIHPTGSIFDDSVE